MRATNAQRLHSPRTARGVTLAIAAAVTGACTSDSREDGDQIVELTAIHQFAANDALNGVRSLSIEGANGDVWVLGATQPFVHHYDSAGTLIASFGRAGEGPGELRPSQEILSPSDGDQHVVVWSAGAGKLARFTRDGAPSGTVGPVAIARTVPTVVERYSYARAIPMSRWGSGFLLQDQGRREGPGLNNVMSLANSALVVLDSTGARTDTLLDFRTLVGASRPPATVTDLAPLPVWTVCPGGDAVVVDPYGMRLRRFKPGGGAARPDTLPVTGEPITDADIERWLRHSATITEVTGGRVVPESVIQDRLRDLLGASRGEVGTVSAPAVRVLCDANGDIWLQRFNSADEPRGLGREWAVVSGGRVARRYRFPSRFQPMALHAGSAFGVQKDSLDIERIAAVRISR